MVGRMVTCIGEWEKRRNEWLMCQDVRKGLPSCKGFKIRLTVVFTKTVHLVGEDNEWLCFWTDLPSWITTSNMLRMLEIEVFLILYHKQNKSRDLPRTQLLTSLINQFRVARGAKFLKFCHHFCVIHFCGFSLFLLGLMWCGYWHAKQILYCFNYACYKSLHT